MPGQWVYKDEFNHKCLKPSGDAKTRTGDIWRCECGKMFRVRSVKGAGDQRDYYYQIEWETFEGTVPHQIPGNRLPNPSVPSWRDR